MDELDLTAVEAEICRLPHVQVARIVSDGPRVTEVHIVATPGKTPKQIVRDVQSVAMATFGLDVDHRTISVVQLGTNGESGTRTADWEDAVAHADPRAAFESAHVEEHGLRAVVRVGLRSANGTVTGFAEGSVASTARHRLVARATLDALQQVEPRAEAVDVDHAEVVRIGGHDVAVVAVVFVAPPVEYSVAGSAVVRAGREADAVARAVLDATNRRLGHITIAP